MKNNAFMTILFSTAILSASHCLAIDRLPEGLRTIKIEYVVTNKNVPQGVSSETYFIDFFKNKMRKEFGIHSELGGRQLTTSEIELFDGAKLYRYGAIQPQRAVFQDVPHYKIAIFARPYQPMKQPVGEEVILGLKCKIYESEAGGSQQKVWSWDGIKIKEVITSSQVNITTEATSVKKNPEFNEGLFTLPEKIKVISMQDFQQEIMSQMKKGK